MKKTSNDERWRHRLGAEAYRVCREQRSERRFSGECYHNHRLGSHLGHDLDDGPRGSAGERYCINSLPLDYEAAGYE